MKLPLPAFKKRYSMEWLDDKWHSLYLFVESKPNDRRFGTTNVYKAWNVYLVWWVIRSLA